LNCPIEKFKANKQELEEVKIKIGNLTTDLKGKLVTIVRKRKIIFTVPIINLSCQQLERAK
jgi:hypothetical protein